MNLTALPGVIIDGKYHIERQLGRGGMGAVFVAKHLGTTRTVAVKVIVPELAAQHEFLQRFQREARAAGRLRHPNVVNVTDFGFTDVVSEGHLAYLVMEFLDGETLTEFLKNTPRPAVDLILEIVDQVALGLDAAHQAGIVHRDLKPDNIWLESNRRGGYNIKVLDFGIAKLNEPEGQLSPRHDAVALSSFPVKPQTATEMIGAAPPSIEASEAPTVATTEGSLPFTSESAANLHTTAGSVLGTPAYMAPEQCQGASVDHRADVYSLSVIAYRIFCGRMPFEARNLRDLLEQQIHETPPAPRSLDRSIPRAVSEGILRGLAKDPAARQNSAGTFAAQLRAGAEAETSLLASGKIYANTYPSCFVPLLLTCFAAQIPIVTLFKLAATALANTKAARVAAIAIAFQALCFISQLFLSQVYKAGASILFEDAAAIGYFRPQLRAILMRLLRGMPQLLATFFGNGASRWGSFFMEGALWPIVWAAEGLSGRPALERAGQLARTQPAATVALVARQFAFLLMAAFISPSVFIAVDGGRLVEYGRILVSSQPFSWMLALQPAYFGLFFLGFGPAFDFLYLSSRRCLGEAVSRTLPSGSRDGKQKAAPTIRPGTVVWLLPGLLMAAFVVYASLPHGLPASVLTDAAFDGRRVAALKAIDSGIPIDVTDTRGRTPLMNAVMDGDLDFMRQLLARGANVNAHMNNGYTPLLLALSSRRPDFARLLVDHKADLSAVANNGRTALIIAAMHGDAEMCRLLLARGADVARRDQYGASALDYAREEGYQELAELLSERLPVRDRP